MLSQTRLNYKDYWPESSDFSRSEESLFLSLFRSLWLRKGDLFIILFPVPQHIEKLYFLTFLAINLETIFLSFFFFSKFLSFFPLSLPPFLLPSLPLSLSPSFSFWCMVMSFNPCIQLITVNRPWLNMSKL